MFPLMVWNKVSGHTHELIFDSSKMFKSYQSRMDFRSNLRVELKTVPAAALL